MRAIGNFAENYQFTTPGKIQGFPLEFLPMYLVHNCNLLQD